MRTLGIVDCLPPGGKRKPGWTYPRPFDWIGLPKGAFFVIVVVVLAEVVRALLRR